MPRSARGIDPYLVAAVVREESSYYPRATSPVGARGLMQLMPSTARLMATRRPRGSRLQHRARHALPRRADARVQRSAAGAGRLQRRTQSRVRQWLKHAAQRRHRGVRRADPVRRDASLRQEGRALLGRVPPDLRQSVSLESLRGIRHRERRSALRRDHPDRDAARAHARLLEHAKRSSRRPPSSDLTTAVGEALAHLLGLPRLGELVKPRSRVTIAFDDATVPSYGPIRIDRHRGGARRAGGGRRRARARSRSSAPTRSIESCARRELARIIGAPPRRASSASGSRATTRRTRTASSISDGRLSTAIRSS